jgi:hypothetical protein
MGIGIVFRAKPSLDLDRHQNGPSDPDPDRHQFDADPQHCLRLPYDMYLLDINH